MSSTTLSREYINEIISHVATNLKITNWKYDAQEFESIGQNYFGVIIPIVLTGITGYEIMRYHIVLKLAPTDERYRVSGAVTKMFNREIFVYSNLFTKYEEFQDLCSTQRFLTPTLYFSRDEYCKEVIAMRDMTEAGFKPYTHTNFLELDHITIALKTLAHFHAMSFILKIKDEKLYEKVIEVCVPLTETSNKRFMEIMIDRLIKALSKFQGTDYQPLLENFKTNCGKLFDDAVAMAKGTCVCHGDIWKENILFQYEDSIPVQACIIDYQTTRISSPAFDILYLIISSTSTELRSNNYHKLLDIYYDSFKEKLKDFEIDCDKIYSGKLLNDDLKLVAPACFVTVNTAMWLSHGLQEDGHVRSIKVWKTPEEKSQAVDAYKSVVKGIIDDFYSYGYLE